MFVLHEHMTLPWRRQLLNEDPARPRLARYPSPKYRIGIGRDTARWFSTMAASSCRHVGAGSTPRPTVPISLGGVPEQQGPQPLRQGHGACLQSWHWCEMMGASRDRHFLAEQSAYPLDICCGTQGVALICGQFDRHCLPVEASDEVFVVGDVPTISVTDQIG